MQKNNLTIFVLICSCLSGIVGGFFVMLFLGNSSEPSNQVQTANIQGLENTVTSLAKEVSPSVVSIVIKKNLPLYRQGRFGFTQRTFGSVETEIGGGTGFFIDTNGTIITNKHVVKDSTASYSVLLNNGEVYDAMILGLDPVNDLALIKIDYSSIPLKLSTKEDSLNIGQFVIAVGNALSEFQNSVSFGVVSGKDRIIQTAGDTLSSLIQTDTAINPGNSGGPLINMSGKVIGINTAIAGEGQGIGFSIAITSEKVAYMLDSIEKHGEIKKPFIGIYYIPMNETIAEELNVEYPYGLYIPKSEDSIIEGSAADSAGLQQGDIILSVDSEDITAENTLDIILQNKFPGEELELQIFRDNEEKTLSLTLGEV